MFSIFGQLVTAQEPNEPNQISLRFKLGQKLGNGIWRIIQLQAIAPKVEPAVVELTYGENATFDIGFSDLRTGEFEIDRGKDILFFRNARSVSYEILEYPGGKPELWFINVNPPILQVSKGDIIKSKVTISLRSPPDSKDAIQSGILKIRIKDTWLLGNMWRPPPFRENPPPPYDKPSLLRPFWTIYAFINGYGFNSGSVDTQALDVDILVKVKPYHTIQFEAVRLTKISPSQVASIPISLENLGNYKDTFGFRIASENEEIKLSGPGSITLKPGESTDTYLAVAIPPSFLDFGTIHRIKIQAYSIDQPNVTIAERTVYLETAGMYVSELSGVGFISIIFIGILIFIFLFYIHKRRLSKICKKPEKPWVIPEEKQYIEKLRKTDKKKYKEVLRMMKDEYLSALHWYKYYRKSISRQSRKNLSKNFVNLFQGIKKKRKQRKINVIKKTEEPAIPKIPVKESKSYPPKKNDILKHETLLKIIKAQEKQKRKFGNSIKL